MPDACADPSEELRLPAEVSAVGSARRFVAAALRRLDLGLLVENAELAVTELVTNVVLHARTPMLVRVAGTGTGARVEIGDGSPVLPRPGLVASTAVSGRGLILVDALVDRWGADPHGGGGKTVWFELCRTTGPSSGEPSPEDLLQMWAALDEAAPSGPPAATDARIPVVLTDVPVEPLLASRANGEDLLRDLQLLLLAPGPPASADAAEQVRLARRLDTAARAAEELRGQLRHQALQAAAQGARTFRLELRLEPADATAAEELSDALDEALELHRQGRLPAAEGLEEHAGLRRWCLRETARRLRADGAAR